MYYIYKITDKTNNKAYIGFTSNPDSRWRTHRGNRYKDTRPLYRAMREHGIQNFSFEILYENSDHDYTLHSMEPYYIDFYNTLKTGYNLTRGGDSNDDNEEIRKKNSERMKHNNPMTQIRNNRGTYKPGNIPIITEERNEKIRKSKLGANNINYKKPQAAEHLNNHFATCSKCGITTTYGNIVRWHENNCKRCKGQ